MAGILTVQTIQGPTSGANANKVIIPAGQTLSVTDGVQVSDMPAGSVIQTLTYTHPSGTALETSSDSFVSTGINLTITPYFTNSKIIITLMGGTKDSNATSVQGVNALYRNINSAGDSFLVHFGSDYQENLFWTQHSAEYVDDSHNTTSTIKYTLYMKSRGSAGIYRFHQSIGGVSMPVTFKIQEIKQ